MFVGSINSKIRNLIFTEKELFRGQKDLRRLFRKFHRRADPPGPRAARSGPTTSRCIRRSSGITWPGSPFARRSRSRHIPGWRPTSRRGGVSRIAAVSLLFEMLKHEKGNNLNQLRHVRALQENFDEFHSQSCSRMEAAMQAIRIDDYTMIDVHDLYRDLPRRVFAVAFLPTYVGGYEKLYARLEKIVSWDAPAYEILTEGAIRGNRRLHAPGSLSLPLRPRPERGWPFRRRQDGQAAKRLPIQQSAVSQVLHHPLCEERKGPTSPSARTTTRSGPRARLIRSARRTISA